MNDARPERMHDATFRRVRRGAPRAIAAVAVVLLVTACCCPPAVRPAAPPAESSAGRLATLPTPDAVLDASGNVTQGQFRRVDFHIALGVVLGIRHLRGEFVSESAGRPVVFDDKESFTIRLAHAEIAIDTASLAHLMNEHVFGYRGAPLRRMSFRTQDGQLVQRGVLRKVVDIPFEMRASVTLTPEGMIRVHPTSMTICSIDGQGLMRALGIELADLLDVGKARGVRMDKNDLILDPEQLLPPPAIAGRLTSVRVEAGRLVQVFGDSATAARLPPLRDDAPAGANYMYFRGGTLRFGKLFMVRSDMRILDLDPSDPFDFSIDRYNDQLVAGYSKNRPDLGLEVFMPDLNELGTPGVATNH